MLCFQTADCGTRRMSIDLERTCCRAMTNWRDPRTGKWRPSWMCHSPFSTSIWMKPKAFCRVMFGWKWSGLTPSWNGITGRMMALLNSGWMRTRLDRTTGLCLISVKSNYFIPNQIWEPDFTVYNSAEYNIVDHFAKTNKIVYPNGMVLWVSVREGMQRAGESRKVEL